MTVSQVRSADAYVGERVHTLLFRNDMTRRELADRLGVSEQTLGKKIRAEKSTFSMDELLALAKAFNVAVNDLLPGEGYEPVLGHGRRRPSPGQHPARLEGFEPPTFWSVVEDRGVVIDLTARRRSSTRIAHAMPAATARSTARTRRHLHVVAQEAS